MTGGGVVLAGVGDIVTEGVVCGSVGPSVFVVGVVIGSVLAIDAVLVDDKGVVVTVVVVVVGTRDTGIWTGLICDT